MKISEIKKIMLEGGTLTNRGTGWYLSSKREAYRTQECFPIPDDIIDKMERNSIIKIDVPYVSAVATLIR